jgi:hypothetical protein
MTFAMGSTNQSLAALRTVKEMKFTGKDVDVPPRTDTPGLAFGSDVATQVAATDDRVVLFDLEVYPNLFVVCWKYRGADNVVKMINPTPQQVERLIKLKLVGFNNRRYDNHMLYGRYMGMSNAQLFDLSQRIIAKKDRSAMFGEAYNLSYADIYDYSSKKQSLKKFQVDLGLKHLELDIPWDQDVPEEKIPLVVEYCCNDVESTEATFEDRIADFTARQILAELSGLTVNDTTARHTAKIIFGNDRNAQQQFVYTDLSEMFPGYVYDYGKSSYLGEDPSEGGYVYAEPGIYKDVAVLDVASMHPTSIIQLNLFGDEYTPKFADLYNARLAIKHGDLASARKMLDGRLAPYLKDESRVEELSYALKIVINIVYGLTSAKFDNPFRDIRNKDNIVAKRGALFMIDLKKFVQDQGFQVVHIKTDSIKIPGATAEIIDQIQRFGEKYGYDFEHEATYSKFCLVNDAVYIAKVGWAEKAKKIGKWEAVGAQFQHPYIYKTLFTNEPLEWHDFCEPKQVSGASIYIDFSESQGTTPGENKLQFIGRIGEFVPVTPESGGGVLIRVSEDEEGNKKRHAVAGSKGFFWMEAGVAKSLGDKIEIDMSYFEHLASQAVEAINKFGDFEEFLK